MGFSFSLFAHFPQTWHRQGAGRGQGTGKGAGRGQSTGKEAGRGQGTGKEQAGDEAQGRGQAGDRAQGKGQAGLLMAPQTTALICCVWKPCLVTVPSHPCPWSPQHRGESQEPTGGDSFPSHFAVHYASSAEQFLAITVFPFTEVLIPRHKPSNLWHALADSLPFADDGCGMWHGVALALACWSLGLLSQCWALLDCHPAANETESLCSQISPCLPSSGSVLKFNSL